MLCNLESSNNTMLHHTFIQSTLNLNKDLRNMHKHIYTNLTEVLFTLLIHLPEFPQPEEVDGVPNHFFILEFEYPMHYFINNTFLKLYQSDYLALCIVFCCSNTDICLAHTSVVIFQMQCFSIHRYSHVTVSLHCFPSISFPIFEKYPCPRALTQWRRTAELEPCEIKLLTSQFKFLSGELMHPWVTALHLGSIQPQPCPLSDQIKLQKCLLNIRICILQNIKQLLLTLIFYDEEQFIIR